MFRTRKNKYIILSDKYYVITDYVFIFTMKNNYPKVIVIKATIIYKIIIC